MRESRRNNLLLAFAVFLIAGSLALYVSLIRSWFGAPAAAAGASPRKTTPQDCAGLPAARLSFRDNFLDPKASLKLSEALYRCGRPVDAFYVSFAARGFFGEEAFARAHAAVVLRKDGYLGGANYDASRANEERIQQRLQNDPDNADLLLYLAHIAADRGSLSEAQKQLDLGLAAHAEDRALLFYKAQLTAPTDGLAAIGFYARAANADPASYEGRKSLDELRKLASEKEEGPHAESAHLAREALDELIKARPDDPNVFLDLAQSMWARGDIPAVEAMVAETLRRKPDHPGAKAMEGALALADHRTDKAIKSFTAAWDKNPDDLFGAEKLAQIHNRQRADRDAALPYYMALYRHNPDYNDGEPAEQIIRETLDSRRAQLLKPVGAEGLGRFLSSEDASLRAEACARAAELKDPRWIEVLGELLDDDTAIVRHNADYALYQIGKLYPDALRVRRDEWLANDRPLMRARVLNLFADLFPQETFPLVLRALYDPQPGVRFLAKTMVLDRYYKHLPVAAKAEAEYLASEKDPAVLALYKRAEAKPEK